MMTLVKRQSVIAALTLSAALSLSACGGPGSDPGVSVDGTDYSVAELQTAVQELNSVLAQPTSTAQVVQALGELPILSGLVAGTPAEITDGQLREVLGNNGLSEPGRATLDAVRSLQYDAILNNPGTFQDPRMATTIERMQALTDADWEGVDVDVNPRYGEWDIVNGLTPVTPEWIQSSNPAG